MASTQSARKAKVSRITTAMDPRVRFKDLLAPVKIRGRPSGYDKKFCKLAIELGAKGKSRATIACEIGITKTQLYRWEDKYEDFREAMEQAKALEQQWWERIGENGTVMAGQINNGLWSKSMSARFRDEYADHQEISGPNGGDIPVKMEVEFVGMKPKKEK